MKLIVSIRKLICQQILLVVLPIFTLLATAQTVFAQSTAAPSLPNQAFSLGGAGEFFLPLPTENAGQEVDRAQVRTLEMTAQGTLDDQTEPTLSAKLTLGANDIVGQSVFNVREAFLNATDVGIKRLDVRIGKFFLPIGLLNQTRRSAWDFVDTPRAFSLFFNDEAIVDTGGDVAYSMGPVTLRAGLTSGYRYDSGIENSGARPSTPTNFARATYRIGETAALGASYLNRLDDQGMTLRIGGADVQYKSGDWNAQGEFYHRYQHPLNLPITADVGGYAYFGRTINRSFGAGLRGDFYQILSLTDVNGAYRKNSTIGVSPVLTYQGREHLRVQLGYLLIRETKDGSSTRSEQVFSLRLVTEFGNEPKFRTPSRDLSWL